MTTSLHDTSFYLLLCKTIRRDKRKGRTREQVLNEITTYEKLRTTDSKDLRTAFEQAVREVFSED